MSKRKNQLKTSNEVLKNGPINVLEYFENDDKNIVFTGNYDPFSIDLNKINFIDFNEDEIKKIIKITPKPLHYLYYNLPFLLPDFPSKFVFKNDYYIDSKRQRILKTNNLKNYPNYTIEYIINEKFINMAKSIDCFKLYRKEYFEHLKIVFGNIINENEFAEKVKNNYIEILEYITKTNGPLDDFNNEDFNNENILIEYEKHFNPLGIERNEYLQELYKIRFSLLNYEKGYKPQSNDIRLEKELIKGLAYIDFLNWLNELKIMKADDVLINGNVINIHKYFIDLKQKQGNAIENNTNEINKATKEFIKNEFQYFKEKYKTDYEFSFIYVFTKITDLIFKINEVRNEDTANTKKLLIDILICKKEIENKLTATFIFNAHLKGIDAKDCNLFLVLIEKIITWYKSIILEFGIDFKQSYFYGVINDYYIELKKNVSEIEPKMYEIRQPKQPNLETVQPLTSKEAGFFIWLLINILKYKKYLDNRQNAINYCIKFNLPGSSDYIRSIIKQPKENLHELIKKIENHNLLESYEIIKLNEYANKSNKIYS